MLINLIFFQISSTEFLNFEILQSVSLFPFLNYLHFILKFIFFLHNFKIHSPFSIQAINIKSLSKESAAHNAASHQIWHCYYFQSSINSPSLLIFFHWKVRSINFSNLASIWLQYLLVNSAAGQRTFIKLHLTILHFTITVLNNLDRLFNEIFYFLLIIVSFSLYFLYFNKVHSIAYNNFLIIKSFSFLNSFILPIFSMKNPLIFNYFCYFLLIFAIALKFWFNLANLSFRVLNHQVTFIIQLQFDYFGFRFILSLLIENSLFQFIVRNIFIEELKIKISSFSIHFVFIQIFILITLFLPFDLIFLSILVILAAIILVMIFNSNFYQIPFFH